MAIASRTAGPMQFDQFSIIGMTDLAGNRLVARAIVDRPTVFLLIEMNGIQRSRLDAEIAWVVERLQPGFDLVLVWPGNRLKEARDCQLGGSARVVIDRDGEFFRAASPDGRRAAILIDPDQRLVEPITGAHSAFNRGGEAHWDERWSGDRTIDLGDVQL
ncbi:MAG TPA: hypothetical protein VD767_04010 [Thermomicrobiales bacterium]|nr:hypothetical protein [Thermomicrobiales bacterium]